MSTPLSSTNCTENCLIFALIFFAVIFYETTRMQYLMSVLNVKELPKMGKI